MHCHNCESDPCHHVMYEEHLRGKIYALPSGLTANAARKSLYITYVMMVHGPQGRGNRIEIPSCILALILELHPDPHNEYMGHKPSARTKWIDCYDVISTAVE